MRVKPWLEIPAYVALALVCAWVSNAAAGPARRLSWWLKEPTPAAVSSLPMPSAFGPLPRSALTPSLPSRAKESVLQPTIKAATTKTIGPVSAPQPDAKTEVMMRFPPLVQEPQATLRGDEAEWLHAHGAVFLDARRTAMYEQGHIPGAKSFSAWEDGLVDKVDQLSLLTADLKLPIVVYCSGGDCHDSHLVAQKLWLAGFRNIRIYTDGYPDWEARNWSVTKGGKP